MKITGEFERELEAVYRAGAREAEDLNREWEGAAAKVGAHQTLTTDC